MTGRELRQAIKDANMTPTQFAERVADLMGAVDYAPRKNAVRKAKRWIEGKKLDTELRLPAVSRSLAATAVGLPESAMLPRSGAMQGDLLAELAAKLGDALEELEDLRVRGSALEAGRGAGEDAPTGLPGAGG